MKRTIHTVALLALAVSCSRAVEEPQGALVRANTPADSVAPAPMAAQHREHDVRARTIASFKEAMMTKGESTIERRESQQLSKASVSVPALARSKPIGSSCSARDGWLPDPLPETPTADGEVMTAPNKVPAGYIDYPHAPAGVPYCQPPDAYEYPHGYFTANCGAGSDCPKGAVCDGRRCRLPCSSDSDCSAPTKCAQPRGQFQVRFCSYYDNPIFTDEKD
jgi:hypothetical protein